MQDKITLAIDALASAAFVEGGVSPENTQAARDLTEQRKRELLAAIGAPCLHQIQEPAANKLLENTPAFYTAIAEHDGGWLPLPEYSAKTSDGVLRRVLERAHEEGYQGGNALERLKELGWAYRPVYFAVDPAQVAPLPLLIQDIARDLGITAVDACQALKDLGNFSVNMAVTAEMAAKLRELFPVPQAAPAAVAVGEREDMQDIVSKALTTAWQLGQTFWRQADSVRHTQHVKSEQTERDFEALIENTRAALATTPAAAPAGWKLVPEVPTDDMIRAFRERRTGGRDREWWPSVLASAPVHPAVGVPGRDMGSDVTDEQIDAILDSRGGMDFVIADKRQRMHLFARRVLALAVPAATPAAAAPVGAIAWNRDGERPTFHAGCHDKELLRSRLDEGLSMGPYRTEFAFTEPQVRALLAGVSAPAAEGSVIRWVSNGLIGARPTTHDLREAIAAAEDCQRCDCADCTKAQTLPLKLVEAINTAIGSNEWQGDALVTSLLEPACKAIANLTLRARADQKARMKIAAALGHEGVNFAWSYLTGAIKELVKADGERLELQPQAQTFQRRVQPWMTACFGPEISADRIERNHRFLEEALELVQSCGCTASEAHQLVEWVFGRPAGEPMQEAGGVMVTHAALCLANGLDMHACGETELARIWTKVEAIRAKQAAKPKHSPLPMHAPETQDALRLAFVLSEIRRDGMDALGAALHDADGFPLDHKASLEAIDCAANAAASGK